MISLRWWQIVVCSLILMAVPFIAGYLTGLSYGWDNGYRYAFHEIRAALAEGIADGQMFRLRGFDNRFYPQSHQQVIIAGAGDQH